MSLMNGEDASDSVDIIDIHEVLRGNTEAFTGIVRRYQKPMMRLALSYLKINEAAEDAVQEIFVKAYRSLPSFSLGKKFKPWLYAIAVNHLKSSYRNRMRRIIIREKEALLSPPDYKDPQETILSRETRKEMLLAVHRLPPDLKDATLLYYMENLSVSETAEILGIGAENVKSRLFRARKKLRDFFDADATDKTV